MSSSVPHVAVVGLGAVLASAVGFLNYRRQRRLHYRISARDAVVENLHGDRVPDPYRWLEAPDSDETVQWIAHQNSLFDKVIHQCETRSLFENKLRQWYNFERFGCPFKRGSRHFFLKNDGLQNQSVLYQMKSLEQPESVLLDPNTLSADGTASLSIYAFSESGNYLAYGVARSGSDWVTIYVKTVPSGEDLPDKLEWVKFSWASWTHDDKGFFYSRYPAPKEAGDSSESLKAGSETTQNENHTLYYHRLGTPQSEDILIFGSPENPKWMMSGEVTDDGRSLVIEISESTDRKNRLYWVDLEAFHKDPKTPLEIVKVIDELKAEYSYITNTNSLFFLKTNLDAPRGKVIAIDIKTKGVTRDVVPQDESGVLSNALVANEDRLVLVYMKDVKEIVKIVNLKGETILESLPTPAAGCISEIRGRRKDKGIFFKFTSFTFPGTIFYYDLSTATSSVFRESKLRGFQPENFFTEQVFYASNDGTRVPMYITGPKNLVRDGSAPTLLYGYGGFDISLLPTFSVARLIFSLHLGGIVAIPNLRGGGEYGEEWHEAGKLHKKQNVFDDMHAAAEYLIEKKYTSASKIAIEGGSNGGLLVAACINQRPELYGCAHAAVGVLDMFRFHKFTIGHAWCAEYGDPDNPEHYQFLKRYSPLHNINTDKPYPAVLLTTADHDDRVVPLHSYKYIAALQDKVASKSYQKKPLVIRIEVKAGHGAGKPLAKVIEEQADVFAFFAKFLGAAWRE